MTLSLALWVSQKIVLKTLTKARFLSSFDDFFDSFLIFSTSPDASHDWLGDDLWTKSPMHKKRLRFFKRCLSREVRLGFTHLFVHFNFFIFLQVNEQTRGVFDYFFNTGFLQFLEYCFGKFWFWTWKTRSIWISPPKNESPELNLRRILHFTFCFWQFCFEMFVFVLVKTETTCFSVANFIHEKVQSETQSSLKKSSSNVIKSKNHFKFLNHNCLFYLFKDSIQNYSELATLIIKQSKVKLRMRTRF